MRMRLTFSGAVLAILVFAAPTFADAPRGEPFDPGPPQYDAFEDSSTFITDLQTKLVWDRDRILKDRDYAIAKTHCDAVFPGVGRMPTVKELLTLVDETPSRVYDTEFNPPFVNKYIDQNAFADTPTKRPYWTSTEQGDMAWTVDFATGKTELRPKTEANHLRCVR